MIDSYDFGVFIINGRKYQSNLVLIEDVPIPARYLPGHELLVKDIQPLVESSPKVIIIGTGFSGVVAVPDEVRDYVKSHSIALIIEPTTRAWKKYNALVKKGEKVAAFLHNTC